MMSETSPSGVLLVQDPQQTDSRSPASDTENVPSETAIKTEEDCKTNDCTKSDSGGRLSFFLDGKLVLELSSVSDGTTKTPWIPVSRKTYWPPPCGSSFSNRHESSASYSLSDDSSLQSSPWQRETRWKQPLPRLNASTAVSFSFLASRPRSVFCTCRSRRRPWLLCTCHSRNNVKSGFKTLSESKPRPVINSILPRLTEKARSKWLGSPLSRKREKVRHTFDSIANPTQKKAKAILAPPQAPPANHFQQTKVYDRQSSYSIDSLLGRERPETSASPSFLLSLLSKTSNGIHSPRLPASRAGVVPFFGSGQAFPASGVPHPLWMPFPLTHLAQLPHHQAGLNSRQAAPISQPPTPDTEEEGPLNLCTSRRERDDDS